MKLNIFLSALCVLFFAISNVLAENRTVVDDTDISEIFAENNAQGTMILESDEGEKFIFNAGRASERLSPASTFKIANSIIALETGVIKDQYEIIKWDGKKRFLEAWNKDQNLKTAIAASCLWFYQGLAKKIGKDQYVKWLAKLDYGNQEIGQEITTFWLEKGGAVLRISADEQIKFLQKLKRKELPVAKRTYKIMEDILLVESTDTYKIYAKSGAAVIDWSGHGWYVGYIVSNGKSWYFATNIIINNRAELDKRQKITKLVLKKKQII